MKHLSQATVLTGALLVGGVTAVVAPVSAGATTCATSWGSLPKSVASSGAPALDGLRAGHHACFDRLVIDLHGTGNGYRVRYVSAVRDQGRGAVVPLRGGAFLQLDVHAAATRRPVLPSVAGYPTFRQVGWGGSFEGETTVGLGVRARLPFRAFHNGDDLVIDVAHRW